MLDNFQRYFRFYLASFLFCLLLVGIRWQAAPLGTSVVERESPITKHAAVVQAQARAVAVQ